MIEPALAIVDCPDLSRYEALLGNTLAGFMEYRLAGARRILVHTEVLPAYEGQGIGVALVRHVLDEARASGIRVTPKCPFILAFLARHPEYGDVVSQARPAR
ncbi:MAG: hypothetical protein HW391_1952 [Chloroflexi bacterium]|nr:hypothetical protein [Chloroflexota bacterium]